MVRGMPCKETASTSSRENSETCGAPCLEEYLCLGYSEQQGISTTTPSCAGGDTRPREQSHLPRAQQTRTFSTDCACQQSCRAESSHPSAAARQVCQEKEKGGADRACKGPTSTAGEVNSCFRAYQSSDHFCRGTSDLVRSKDTIISVIGPDAERPLSCCAPRAGRPWFSGSGASTAATGESCSLPKNQQKRTIHPAKDTRKAPGSTRYFDSSQAVGGIIRSTNGDTSKLLTEHGRVDGHGNSNRIRVESGAFDKF